jgi:hypothetical protein
MNCKRLGNPGQHKIQKLSHSFRTIATTYTKIWPDSVRPTEEETLRGIFIK